MGGVFRTKQGRRLPCPGGVRPGWFTPLRGALVLLAADLVDAGEPVEVLLDVAGVAHPRGLAEGDRLHMAVAHGGVPGLGVAEDVVSCRRVLDCPEVALEGDVHGRGLAEVEHADGLAGGLQAADAVPAGAGLVVGSVGPAARPQLHEAVVGAEGQGVGDVAQEALGGVGGGAVQDLVPGALVGALVRNGHRVLVPPGLEGHGAAGNQGVQGEPGVDVLVGVLAGPLAGIHDVDVGLAAVDGGDVDARQEVVVVVVGVEDLAKLELLEVVDAADGAGLLPGLGERGQKHGGKNRDDGDDHQQFNQGECLLHKDSWG